MHIFLILLGLFLLAFAINLPFGYLRQGCEKFTFGWYFYVHISIPFLIYLRVKAGYSWKYIPITLGGAMAGQLVGGFIQRRRNSNG